MFENLKTAYRFMTICVSERLTLALRGGVVATPPRVFPRWPENGGAQRRQIWHNLWCILCASSGAKNFMTSLPVLEL